MACACVVGNRVVGTCVVETKVLGTCGREQGGRYFVAAQGGRYLVVESEVVGTSWKRTGWWVLSERERGGRSFVVENEVVDIQRYRAGW